MFLALAGRLGATIHRRRALGVLSSSPICVVRLVEDGSFIKLFRNSFSDLADVLLAC